MIGSRAAIEYAARSPIDTTFPSTYAHLTLKLNRTPPEYNDASKLEALPRGYLASKRRSYRCHYLAV